MYINFGSANGKKDFFGNAAKVTGTHHKLIKVWPFKIWIGYEHYIVVPDPSNKFSHNLDLKKYSGKAKKYIEVKFF